MLVKIQAKYAIRARRHNHVREQLGSNRDPRLVLAVLPRVSVIRHHASDPRRRSSPCRIDQEQQLHDVVGRRVRRLHDEDVVASDGLVDSHEDLAISEPVDRRVAKRDIERSSYLAAEIRVTGSAEKLEAMSGYGQSVHAALQVK